MVEQAEEVFFFFGSPHRGCPGKRKERQKSRKGRCGQPKRIKRHDFRGIRILDAIMANLPCRSLCCRLESGIFVSARCRGLANRRWENAPIDQTAKQDDRGTEEPAVKDSAGRIR